MIQEQISIVHYLLEILPSIILKCLSNFHQFGRHQNSLFNLKNMKFKNMVNSLLCLLNILFIIRMNLFLIFIVLGIKEERINLIPNGKAGEVRLNGALREAGR